MSMVASQITSLTIVYSSVNSGAEERKQQSSASLAFVRGIHRWPVTSLHKGPIMWKLFPFDDVIMVWVAIKGHCNVTTSSLVILTMYLTIPTRTARWVGVFRSHDTAIGVQTKNTRWSQLESLRRTSCWRRVVRKLHSYTEVIYTKDWSKIIFDHMYQLHMITLDLTSTIALLFWTVIWNTFH